MSNPTNKELYSKVLAEAKRKFKVWPSAYGSMWLTKTYKERGGTYSGDKSEQKGTSRWLDEDWVNMEDYLSGKHTKCGMPEGRNKACRPKKRVSQSTPITASEVVKKHGKDKVRELVNAKKKDQSGTRINWNTGTISKKKN